MEVKSKNIDELIECVHTPLAKKYIKEAYECYNSKSYRGSIILTWIAICTDIIYKIEVLNNFGDGRVKELYKKISKCQDKPSEFYKEQIENKLLEQAKEAELLTEIEFKHLEDIKEERNRCAHPAVFQGGQSYDPEPEQAKLHMIHACKYLLCQGPTQGRFIVDEIVRQIINCELPQETKNLKEYLFSPQRLQKSRDTTIRQLVNSLLKNFFNNEELRNHSLIIITRTLSELITHPEYKMNSRDTFSKYFESALIHDNKFATNIFYFLEENSSFWEMLPISVRSFITAFAESDALSFDELTSKKMISGSSGIKQLEEIVLNSIQKFSQLTYTIEGLVNVTRTYKQKIATHLLSIKAEFYLKDFVMDTFLSSETYSEAINWNEVLVKYAPLLTEIDLGIILEGCLTNQSQWGPYKYNQIIDNPTATQMLSNLYNATKDITNASVLWGDFMQRLNQEKYSEIRNKLSNIYVPF
jgi:hypothetical protein